METPWLCAKLDEQSLCVERLKLTELPHPADKVVDAVTGLTWIRSNIAREKCTGYGLTETDPN